MNQNVPLHCIKDSIFFMIDITGKQLCCGCGACVQRCPKRCITMNADTEGFLYPVVDRTICIDCGLCEKVCPFIHPEDERHITDVLAVINNDEAVRRESSSGGVFTLISERVLDNGGVVFGARFDKDWQVVLDYTESIDGLAAFRGSKYVQARTDDAFRKCEDFLKQGRDVLFTGSPCQIAGLNHYLRKKYDNLLTCDFVCHGAPSPKVWRMYLDEVVRAGGKAITDVKFRNKRDGLKRFNFILSYDNGAGRMSLSSFHDNNHYMRAFLHDMILRPSCHSCKAKQGRSGSDMTIADFWGIQNHHQEMDDDKGTSLVIINTEKGRNAIDLSKTRYLKTDYVIASRYNAGLHPSVKPHPKRDRFFCRLDDCYSVVDLISECTKPPFNIRMKMTAKSLIKKVKKLFGGNVIQKYRRSLGWHDEWHDADLRNIYSISNVTFREKTDGWKEYRMKIEF